MAVSVNGQITPVNWGEVVSSELRAWWEVLASTPARQPDPMYRMPPPLVSQTLLTPTSALTIPASGGIAIDQRTLLIAGAVLIAVVLLNR